MNDSIVVALITVMAITLTLVIVLLIVVLTKNNKKENDNLLLSINNNVLKSINQNNDVITDNLLQLSKDVSEALRTSTKDTKESIDKVNEKIAKVEEAGTSIKDIRKDLLTLNNTLTDKKSRGTLGEIELYNLLDIAYGSNTDFYERQYMLSNGTKVDAILKTADDKGDICIDSKFPLENYNRIYEETNTKEQQNTYRKEFVKNVKKHIDDISSKYLIDGETADMAFMFVPSEAVFSEIYANCFEDIVEYSYKKKVYIVSPTTLMAYTTVYKNLMLNNKIAEGYKTISAELLKLSQEFEHLTTRTDNLVKHYVAIGQDFKDIQVTTDKINKSFVRISKADID